MAYRTKCTLSLHIRAHSSIIVASDHHAETLSDIPTAPGRTT